MILGINPRIISNGRIQGPGQQVPGVSFGTPEQELGAFNMKSPWESCVTMQGEGWFWNGGKDIRSADSCLRLLVGCATGDGNLLLDFGPDELGRIHPDVQRNLAAMGAWLRRHGSSIYGTRGGPYMPGPWGGPTRKDRTVYLHITQTWPGGRLVLPRLPRTVVASKVLTGGGATVTQATDGLSIGIDPRHHPPVDTVVALELDSDAMSIEPIPTAADPWASLTVDARVTASSAARFWASQPPDCVVLHGWEKKGGGPAPAGMEDLRDKHRGHIWRAWVAEDKDPQPWIELDLGRPRAFDRVVLREKFNRIRAFKLQAAGDGGWRTFFEGAALDTFSLHLPEPIVARKVRLVVTDSFREEGERFQGPGLQAFDLHGPGRE